MDISGNKVDEGFGGQAALDQLLNESKLMVAMLSALPYPLVVKATKISMKEKAIVFDAGGLAHFRQKIDSNIIAEEYIAHDNKIIKLYNIGDAVLVVERPSLPDINPDLPPSAEELEAIRQEIDGEIIHTESQKVGDRESWNGVDEALKSSVYITFGSGSLTQRRPHLRSGNLTDDQFSHLDRELLASLAEKCRLHVGHPFLGIDVIISSANGVHYVVDLNCFPGFKGIRNPEASMRKYLSEEARKRALEADYRSLKPIDVMEMAISFNDEWRKRHVTPRQLKVRHLTMNRVFEVNFLDEETRKEVRCRNTLVKLYARGKSEDEAGKMKSIHEALTERGILPGGIQSLKTSYFDNLEVEVGFVQPWASAKSLQILLTKEPNTLPADIWRQLGASIARHQASTSVKPPEPNQQSQNEEQKKRQQKAQQEKEQQQQQQPQPQQQQQQQQRPSDVRKSGENPVPLENGLMEKILENAMSAFAASAKRDSVSWKTLFDKFFLIHESLPKIKDVIFAGLANSGDSKRIVFSNTAVDILANIQVYLELQQQQQEAEELEKEVNPGEMSETGNGENRNQDQSPMPESDDNETNKTFLKVGDIKILVDADDLDSGIVGPNFVGIDLANVVVNVAVLKARLLTPALGRGDDREDQSVGEIESTEALIGRVAKDMVIGYLEAMEEIGVGGGGGGGGGGENTNQSSDDGQDLESSKLEETPPEDPLMAFESRITSFVDDVLTLSPIAALTNACRCILRASAEGQLRSLAEKQKGDDDDDDDDDDDGVIRRKDRKFNWLRHAKDHMTIYEEQMKRVTTKTDTVADEIGDGKRDDEE